MNSWLLFALMAPFLWALTNVLDSALRRHFIKDELAFTWVTSAARLPFVVLLLLFGGFQIPPFPASVFLFLGGVLWTLPFLFYYKAMEIEEPSRIALLMQLVPVFTLTIAYFALGERLTFFQSTAFILLILGGGLAGVRRFEKQWHLSKAILYLVVAGFLWASSDILFKKYELVSADFFSAFSMYFLGSFALSLALLFHSRGRKRILPHFKKLTRRAWVILITSLTAGMAGSVAFTYALTIGKASLTAVLIGAQPLFVLGFGLLFARWGSEFHKEDLTRPALMMKGISFLLIFAGLIFLNG